MRLGRCEGVQERLRICVVGDKMMVLGDRGVSVSIMTMSMSPLSDGRGEEKP